MRSRNRRRDDERGGYNRGQPSRSQGAGFSMKRKAYGRDAGLTAPDALHRRPARDCSTSSSPSSCSPVLNVGLVPMLVIVVGLAFFQYFTSDKLALKASGAKIVTADEAPRAARDGRAALRDGRPAEAEGRDHPDRRAERVRDRPQPEARGRRRHRGPLAPARAAGDRGRARPRALAHRQPRRPRS